MLFSLSCLWYLTGMSFCGSLLLPIYPSSILGSPEASLLLQLWLPLIALLGAIPIALECLPSLK